VIVTAKNRAIPLFIPVGFFFLGEGFLLAFALLFTLHPEALAIPRHPLGLAMAHLLLMGFGVGVLLGAMHQLVPVVLEAPLYRHIWGYPVMLLWGLGTVLLATGFAWNPALVPWGGGLALLGLSFFAYHMLRTFRMAPRWNRVATALAWVVLYLVLTPVPGLFQSLTQRYGSYDPDRFLWHLLLGFVGIFLLSSEEFPPRTLTLGKGATSLGIPWKELFPLLDEAYHPLFQALREAGVPPPTEGPEDVELGDGTMIQSLARWGGKRLFPKGSGGEGLEVDPSTPLDAVRRYLGL